jgi:glycosyltransferase involved in cell wall biosynthesis
MLLEALAENLRGLNYREQTELIDECVKHHGVVETVAALARNFCWERQLIADTVARSSLFKSRKQEIKTIGMFYHRFYNGGTENIMAVLTDVFGDMGYKVVIFTDDEPNELDYQTRHPYVRVTLPPHGEVNNTYAKRAETLLGALQEHSVDCFVWHAWMSDLTLWDMLVIKSEGIPFITYTHSCFAFPALTADWLYHYDMPSVFALMDGIVVLSRVDKAYWSTFNSNVHYLNQPLKASLVKQEVPTPSSNKLVWVGRISYEKNPAALIKIMEKVSKEIPSARLTIVGKAETQEEQEAFANIIAEHGLSEAMPLVGLQKDVDPYYAEASILVSTSIVEGFLLTILEAKGFGVPCVMYDLPYLETVRNGEGVVAIPLDDSDGFAEQLIDIMRNDARRLELSRAAKQSLTNYLAKQDTARDWERVFKSLSDADYRQPLDIDNNPNETKHILWQTNNRYTELGLRSYVHKTNMMFSALRSDITQLESSKELLHQDNEQLKNDIVETREFYETSKPYRIGLAITYLPRKIKSMLSR